MPERREERVLVLAPTGKDAALVGRLLAEAGIRTEICRDFDALESSMREGAGAILATEEGLPPEALERLVAWIGAQPAWSDLPLLLLTLASRDRADALYTALGPTANLRLLERPLSAAVLLAAVRAALRDRRRQYEVRALLAELQAADSRKDDFMALLGHELRNPLAAIKTAVQLLQRRASDDPAMERVSGLIERQTDSISRLIEDLLEISRVARGKLTIERQEVDLRALVAGYVRDLRVRSDTRDRRITVDLPEGELVAEVDPLRIEQVLGNLVTNALKYTPPPGGVHVELSREGDVAVLQVKDEGIGIAKDALPRIFEAFMQVDEARGLAQGGLGLGLPLVRNLVELHGGSVHAHSDGKGTGSEFTVRLPLRAPEEPAPAG